MNVLTVDYRSSNAPQDFAHSLQATGFGVLKNHPISWPKIQEVYQEWLAFFNSPLRYDYLMDVHHPDRQDGYVPLDIAEKAKGAKVKDIKEFYQAYFPWGRYPKNISPKTRELFYEMFELGKTLCVWLEAYMPAAAKAKLSEPLTEMLSVERTQLRIIHYPGLKGSEEVGAVRAAPHEDINLLTVLPAATEPGLQVMGSDGHWQDVSTDPGTLVVNIGDMLQEATDHFYKSTTHRVLNPAGVDMSKPRLSIPLFVHARADVKISDRYTADSYLTERLIELGLKHKM